MEALPEHTIAFAGLKEGIHHFRFGLGGDFFASSGEEEWEGGSVTVNVALEKRATLLVANIELSGRVEVHCDRCDAPMDLQVTGSQRQIFQLNSTEEFDDEELVGLEAGATDVNLTHYFYECLRLALPGRHVHPPGQCDPEVAAVLDRIAVDRHARDPRWDILDRLKTKRP